MKFKVVIALFLALVMVLTLAAPALAAGPVKQDLINLNGTGTAKASFQATHDNLVKVTVVISNGAPDKNYQVEIGWPGQPYYQVGTISTSSQGRGRLSEIVGDASELPFPSDTTYTFSIVVWEGSTQMYFKTGYAVYFK